MVAVDDRGECFVFFFCFFCFSCFLYTLLEVLILFVMKLSFGLLSFSVRALLLWVLSFSEVDLVDLRGVNLFCRALLLVESILWTPRHEFVLVFLLLGALV